MSVNHSTDWIMWALIAIWVAAGITWIVAPIVEGKGAIPWGLELPACIKNLEAAMAATILASALCVKATYDAQDKKSLVNYTTSTTIAAATLLSLIIYTESTRMAAPPIAVLIATILGRVFIQNPHS